MTNSSMTRRGILKGAAALSGAGLLTTAAEAFAQIPHTDGYATVPGGRIYWRKYGAGPKTPLLTLHGGPGSSHNYLLPLQALADERPIIFYDQLGCGRADAPNEDDTYSIQRSVDEVDAVRSALNLDRVIMLGHSWGALLAVEYLCQGGDGAWIA